MKFKRTISKFIITTLVFSFFGVSSVFAATKAVTTGSKLNIRENKSTDSNIVGMLDIDQELNLVEDCGDWFKIRLNDGSEAYISSQFVKIVYTDGEINDSGVNIRSQSNTSCDILGQASMGDIFSLSGLENDFYITTYNGQKVYIHKDFVDVTFSTNLGVNVAPPSTGNQSQSVYGVVIAENGINLRLEPSTDAAILASLPYSYYVDILGTSGDWYKVKIDDGTVGYTVSEFMSSRQGTKPSRQQVQENSKGQQIVNYGKKFLGTPYVWGGTSLSKGVDCSGFVYAVYKHFGVTLNRNSRAMANNGSKVTKDNLQPGDLVFFGSNGGGLNSISHVGIYMGGGKFIHSSSSRSSYCVTISSLYDSSYSRSYVAARRVF